MSDWVGGIAQAKEELWEYAIPPLNEAVTTIVVSLDGAYVLMRDEGYREAMVGNISLYDVTGERLHTLYIGEAPEYGKGSFFQRLEQELATVKKHYPDALYLGIADGAKTMGRSWSNIPTVNYWTFFTSPNTWPTSLTPPTQGKRTSPNAQFG